MKKKIMTLMMGMLLLLTACGQAKDSSASTMLPVAAVQSAAQAIAPVEDKTQDDAESLPAGEDTEKAESAGGEETPNPAVDVETPSAKTEETPSAPNGGEQPRRRCGHSIALSHESCAPRQYAGHPACAAYRLQAPQTVTGEAYGHGAQAGRPRGRAAPPCQRQRHAIGGIKRG